MNREKRSSLIQMQMVMLVAACALLVIGLRDRPARGAGQGESVFVIDLALYLFLSPVTLVLHELGHVLAGKVAGVRMWAVIIGMGPRLIRFSVGGIVVEIHAVPAYGFVRGSSYGQSAWRLRRIIWIAGGPLVNLIVAACVTAVQWNRFVDGSQYDHVSVWLALGAVNAVFFLASMFGPGLQISDLRLTPDGKQLYSLIFKRRQLSDEQRKLEFITHRGAWLFSENREPEVVEMIRQPLVEDPDHFMLRYFQVLAQLGMGEFDGAKKNLKDLLAGHEKVDAARVAVLNALAWTELCRGGDSSLDVIEAWSAEANLLTPWDASVRSTHGWVLVEKGDFEGGVRMLQASMRDADSRSTRASIFCTLAIAAARQRNNDAVQLNLKKASKLDGESAHLRHIRGVIDGLQQRSVVDAMKT